ncbi:hypothetical protein [Streptomyces sp. 8K308]|nr:hypothetical protein [Streptomyces sp. 8K308]
MALGPQGAPTGQLKYFKENPLSRRAEWIIFGSIFLGWAGFMVFLLFAAS